MSEELDGLVNVVERWESLGLLEGLPLEQKYEMAQIYDNATKLLLSDRTLTKVPKKISDTMDDVFIPICRRLYKRVGPEFDLENMMSELLQSVNDNISEISKPTTKENNPILEFCINFADGYEDEVTNKKSLTKAEYGNEIKNLLTKLEDILLNDKLVSYVDRNGSDYVLNTRETAKTNNQIRFWNQSVAKNLIETYLSNLNKGL
jgi:hypothetical protein